MKFGLEKEFLMFNDKMQPLVSDVASLPANIVLDYADHQFELVSDVSTSIEELYSKVHQALDEPVITSNIMWPLSQPGKIDYDITTNGTLTDETIKYRQGLTKKYDKEMLLISGIHFNISLNDDKQLDKEAYYFELMKKIYLYGPILQQFVAFTPKMYLACESETTEDLAISLRNTHKYGYYNEMNLNLDFTSFSAYQKSIDQAIADKLLQSKKELYAKVRYKENGGNPYLELRFIDLNPYYRAGISYEHLNLLSIFTRYLDSININEFDFDNALFNFETVAFKGRDRDIKLLIDGKMETLYNHTLDLLNAMVEFSDDANDVKILNTIIDTYINQTMDLYRLCDELDTMSIDDFGHKHAFRTKQFKKTYEEYDMELSTKILMQEAEEQGYIVEVLDDVNNVVKIGGELFVQATKTNADTYANILMLENKYMTKKILDAENVAVPYGVRYKKGDEIDYTIFKDKKMVVKPEDTNFGIGITMLEANPDQDVIKRAIKFAFDNSDKVIIEETIEGTEYRFLVIEDKCVSIIKRVPAHVIGDGINTIEELVKIKNTNPLRSTGYVTPVELIKLGDFEIDFIKQRGLTINNVPNKGEVIYLRNNSNVSTGGDTVEMLEQVPRYYQQVAIDATKALGVNICGIDMIIEDLFDHHQQYGIIEANFNPAIQMHTYPLVGYGKTPAKDILNLVLKNK